LLHHICVAAFTFGQYNLRQRDLSQDAVPHRFSGVQSSGDNNMQRRSFLKKAAVGASVGAIAAPAFTVPLRLLPSAFLR
jgi:hypothetical protein